MKINHRGATLTTYNRSTHRNHNHVLFFYDDIQITDTTELATFKYDHHVEMVGMHTDIDYPNHMMFFHTHPTPVLFVDDALIFAKSYDTPTQLPNVPEPVRGYLIVTETYKQHIDLAVSEAHNQQLLKTIYNSFRSQVSSIAPVLASLPSKKWGGVAYHPTMHNIPTATPPATNTLYTTSGSAGQFP